MFAHITLVLSAKTMHPMDPRAENLKFCRDENYLIAAIDTIAPRRWHWGQTLFPGLRGYVRMLEWQDR